jgi:DNA-binding SARP family transcriptional activator/Tfp pilus assembly protein PilF/TolB-like protein
VVRIHLIGDMQATTYDGADVLPRGRKARAILGLVCLAGGAPVKRDDLAARLWDRVPRNQGFASLRQALRELTAPLAGLPEEIFIADRETIRLNAKACWIDALALTEPSLGAIRRELAKHCTGELLAGLDDVSASFGQWAIETRARFTEKLRNLLDHEADGNPVGDADADARVRITRRLIQFGPTYEAALRVLMRSLADLGQPEQALAEYDRLAFANVSPETRALYQAIRSGASAANGLALSPVVPPKTGIAAAPPPRNRRRVAVLPFESLRADSETALSDSVEVAGELGRYRWFDVVDPMAFGGGLPVNGASFRQERRDEIDYVIDGVVSGTGDNRAISVRMLNLTTDAAPIWSREAAPHRVNELITEIVQQIDPVSLLIGNRVKPLAKTRAQRRASELLLRAIPLMYSMQRGKYEIAGQHLRDAMEEDPENARVAAWAAYWHVFHVGQKWATDPDAENRQASTLAAHALQIDPNNAEALGISGHISAFLEKDLEKAMSHFDRALRINPNLAHVLALSAPTCCYVGKAEIALDRLRRYRELAPYDPYFKLFETMYTVAYVFLRDWKRAADVGRRSVANNPGFSNGYKPLIAALGHLGLREEAEGYVKALLGMEQGFTVERFGREYPFTRDSDRQSYQHGLRLAGVPED